MIDYRIVTLNDIDERDFYKFCRIASLQNDPAATNMWADNWHTQSHTLPYILRNTDRYAYPSGEFFIILFKSEIIGCGGVYSSEFDNEFVLAGSRTWVDKTHRNKLIIREILLPAQKKWAQSRNASAIGLTFNEYNKNMKEMWKRFRLGENRSPRQPHHLFYKNFNEVEFPVTIQYTKQWVIYEKLNNSWNFDWTQIECK